MHIPPIFEKLLLEKKNDIAYFSFSPLLKNYRSYKILHFLVLSNLNVSYFSNNSLFYKILSISHELGIKVLCSLPLTTLQQNTPKSKTIHTIGQFEHFLQEQVNNCHIHQNQDLIFIQLQL